MAFQARLAAAAVSGILLTILQAVSAQTSWTTGATATYYGGSDASGTNQGACGYGNQIPLYGKLTTALSSAFFQNALLCGACYEIQCTGSSYCLSGKTVKVTATNLCPDGSYGGWCDGSKKHFDLAEPAFIVVAQKVVGHFQVQYRRVTCARSGGVRFTMNGNANWNLVLVSNVGGVGDVTAVSIKGSKMSSYASMKRNWGENWEYSGGLLGQSVSFQVTTSNKVTKTFTNIVSSNWQLTQTFSSSVQF